MEDIHQLYNIFVLQVTQSNHLLLHHLAIYRPSIYAQHFNCYVEFINLVVHQGENPESPLPNSFSNFSWLYLI